MKTRSKQIMKQKQLRILTNNMHTAQYTLATTHFFRLIHLVTGMTENNANSWGCEMFTVNLWRARLKTIFFCFPKKISDFRTICKIVR